MPTKLLDGN